MQSTLWAIWLLVPDPYFKPSIVACEVYLNSPRLHCIGQSFPSRSKPEASARESVIFGHAEYHPRRKCHSQPLKLDHFESLGGFRQSEKPLFCLASLSAGSLGFCNNSVKNVLSQCRCGFDQNQHSFENNQDHRQWQKRIVNSPRPTMASVHPVLKVDV